MNVTIFGLGITGNALIEYFIGIKAKISISEKNIREKVLQNILDTLKKYNIDAEFGGHSDKFICGADLIVVSPGVHLDIPPLELAKKNNIPIISEIELAYQKLTKPIIAITGTNGKTTTTTLVGEIIRNAGLNVAVAGNIGFPMIAVDDDNLDYIVAEISSYQLEATIKFKPKISAILNLAQDHLERHKTMALYSKAKAKIFQNQDKNDYFVYNHDNDLVSILAKDTSAVCIPFSRKYILKHGAFVDNGSIVYKDSNTEVIIRIDDIRIKGDHNIENALACVAIAKLLGIKNEVIESTIKDFKGVEHRIEYVDTISGVAFINDSKGTNTDSTVVALKTISNQYGLGKVILIAGGRDKGGDLADFVNQIKESARAVVLLGEAKERFRDALIKNSYVNYHIADTFEDSIRKSFSLAGYGDVVLLSPACASFDMFSNYEERGDIFKNIVRKLKNETAKI